MLQTFKVTKAIIKQAAELMLEGGYPSQCCAVTLAVRKKYPTASIGGYTGILDDSGSIESVVTFQFDTVKYMSDFDHANYEQRLELPEIEFSIEINPRYATN